ncbi:transcriptional regulator [Actinocatenispora thailandica]|nr:DUF5753 domain-containing protein [Actinocatenispora thailandica]BCJ35848.1 transcriptional regulator [Actinocatenispora thailandica]
MVETLQRTPTADFTAACDAALDTGGALSTLLPMLARDTFPKWFQSFVHLEEEARSINEFEVQLIPGLLQTADYARAVLETAWPPAPSVADADGRLTARLARQAVLERDPPPLLSVVLDESALRRPVGGPSVMARQLRHLTLVAARPHVRLHILTYAQSATAPLDGSFTVLETVHGEHIAYVEATGGGQLLPDPTDVERLTKTFEGSRGEALSTAESINYVDRLRKELYEHRRDSAAVVEE